MAFAKWSPGSVLRYLLVKSLAEEGRFPLLDLGPGDASYKESMATGSVLCANVYYFRMKPRYLGMVGIHLALSATAAAIVKVLDALRLRERVKMWFIPRADAPKQAEQTA